MLHLWKKISLASTWYADIKTVCHTARQDTLIFFLLLLDVTIIKERICIQFGFQLQLFNNLIVVNPLIHYNINHMMLHVVKHNKSPKCLPASKKICNQFVDRMIKCTWSSAHGHKKHNKSNIPKDNKTCQLNRLFSLASLWKGMLFNIRYFVWICNAI